MFCVNMLTWTCWLYMSHTFCGVLSALDMVVWYVFLTWVSVPLMAQVLSATPLKPVYKSCNAQVVVTQSGVLMSDACVHMQFVAMATSASGI